MLKKLFRPRLLSTLRFDFGLIKFNLPDLG